MLYQLHWQGRDGTAEIKAQREINTREEMDVFIEETKATYPLPQNAMWMMCTEGSKYFVLTKVDQGVREKGEHNED